MSVETLIKEAVAAIEEKQAENLDLTNKVKQRNQELEAIANKHFYAKESVQVQLATLDELNGEVPEEKATELKKKLNEKLEKVLEEEQEESQAIVKEIQDDINRINELRKEIRELDAKKALYEEITA